MPEHSALEALVVASFLPKTGSHFSARCFGLDVLFFAAMIAADG
jgi:hypothetical protein